MGNFQPHAVLHLAETVLTAIADCMYNLVVLLQGQLLSTAANAANGRVCALRIQWDQCEISGV
jgi:hypothetical protein